jgi:hypothetical protein
MVVQMSVAELETMIQNAVRSALSQTVSLSQKTAPAEDKSAPQKKTKKERDPDAPKREPNDWIKFTCRVRAVISAQLLGQLDEKGAQKKAHPKAVTQTASSLKEAGHMVDASDEQILSAYKTWLANPQPSAEKVEKAEVVEVAEVSAEEKAKKVRKPQSEETKKAAAAKRAATKAAKETAEVVEVVAAPPAAEPSAEEKAKKVRKPQSEETKKAAAAKRAATKAAKETVVAEASAEAIQDFEPFTHEGVALLKNARGDVLTETMEWVGRLSGKSINKTIAKPADLDI